MTELKEMTFLDHLEELRWRIVKALIALVILTVISFNYSNEILLFVIKPYHGKLIYTAPGGAFIIRIKLSMFAGLIFSSPVIFYQLWQFVAPGLFKNERKYFVLILFITTFCFLVGAVFAYRFVLPAMLDFFATYQTDQLQAYVSVDEYFSLLINFVLAMGGVFELPVVSFFLAKLGILSPQFLKEKRRYAIVIIFIVAAVITPSPDFISQFMIAIPLLVLYEISVFVTKYAVRKTP